VLLTSCEAPLSSARPAKKKESVILREAKQAQEAKQINSMQRPRPLGMLVFQIKMLHNFMSYKSLWNTDMPMEDKDQKMKF